MCRFKIVCSAVFLLAVSLPLLAQSGRSSGTSASTPSGSNAGISNSNNGAGNGNSAKEGAERREPCWKVAGISPSVMQQRRSIEQSAKSQVTAVCSDTSVSAQQRTQQLKTIHQQAQQEIQSLITAQQESAMKACRAAREQGEQGKQEPHPQATGKGPCGEVAEEPAGSASSTSSHKFN
jgi:hypothetical protein